MVVMLMGIFVMASMQLKGMQVRMPNQILRQEMSGGAMRYDM